MYTIKRKQSKNNKSKDQASKKTKILFLAKLVIKL